MALTIYGPFPPTGSRSKDGDRTYKIKYRVHSDSGFDGPYNVLRTPGLPLPGSPWILDNDFDPWAWCRFEAEVTPVVTNERCFDWDVEFTFSTAPLAHCQDYIVEDPLREPMKVSVSFRNVTEEATHDIFGRRLANSAHEALRGHAIEFDRGLPTVRIEQNVPGLDFDTMCEMIDTVNDSEMWGFGPRCVRLSRINLDCLYSGQCEPYVKRVLEFEIDPKTWDRDVLDEGTSVLQGRWSADRREWIVATIGGKPADPKNPMHFQQFKDPLAQPKHVVLNGAGLPADTFVATQFRYVSIQDSNTNNALDDSRFWIPIVTTDTPEPWHISLYYPVGSLVKQDDTHYWVATENIPPGYPDPTELDLWVAVPRFVDSGAYNVGFTYSKGEYVYKLTKTEAGKLFIQYYDESNFFLLGVPTAIQCPTLGWSRGG